MTASGTVTITSTGNAGVRIENGGRVVFVDSFFSPALWVGSASAIGPATAGKADIILVTHDHFDHFDPGQVAEAALASGALVAGPQAVVSALRGILPEGRVAALEPKDSRQGPADSVTRDFSGIKVTAFRTFHCRGHNSYLVEMGAFRAFHDGDNERTRRLDLSALGRVDALFLCPWRGSGAAGFVAALKPGRWFLVHLTEDEISEHGRGAFLPGLCDPAPEGVIALSPGRSIQL